jgi:hypothetical protein
MTLLLLLNLGFGGSDVGGGRQGAVAQTLLPTTLGSTGTLAITGSLTATLSATQLAAAGVNPNAVPWCANPAVIVKV